MNSIFSTGDKQFLRAVGISTEPTFADFLAESTFAEERMALAQRIAQHSAPGQCDFRVECYFQVWMLFPQSHGAKKWIELHTGQPNDFKPLIGVPDDVATVMKFIRKDGLSVAHELSQNLRADLDANDERVQ